MVTVVFSGEQVAARVSYRSNPEHRTSPSMPHPFLVLNLIILLIIIMEFLPLVSCLSCSLAGKVSKLKLMLL